MFHWASAALHRQSRKAASRVWCKRGATITTEKKDVTWFVKFLIFSLFQGSNKLQILWLPEAASNALNVVNVNLRSQNMLSNLRSQNDESRIALYKSVYKPFLFTQIMVLLTLKQNPEPGTVDQDSVPRRSISVAGWISITFNTPLIDLTDCVKKCFIQWCL